MMVTIYPTKCERDACDTVQSRAAEFDMIVCSGGDGTLDEVVTGLMNSGEKKPVGYHPGWQYDDFANSWYPKPMEQAAKLVRGGRAVCMRYRTV